MDGVVVKYGGSSVATTQLISQVAEHIIRRKQQSGQVVAVVSAMGKTTNGLIETSRQVAANPPKREMDMLLATGEQVSIALLAMALQEKGCPAVSMTGWQAGIVTEQSHSNSRIYGVDTQALQQALQAGNVVVVAGFQGVSEQGEITTLGRGGSDTTAVALAAALGWPCEIYTDVDGIYTVDPRLHPGAKKIDEISHEETLEMSNLGAKVIEPRSVELAAKYGVDLSILLNSGGRSGTRIKAPDGRMEENLINKISVIDKVLLVSVIGAPGFNLAQVFVRLAEEKVNVDLISQSPSHDRYQSVAFTASMESQADIKKVLSGMNLVFDIKQDNCKVSVVGNAMRNHPGVAAQAFKAFYAHNIPFYQVSTSEISISYIIDEANKEKAVRILISEFGL